MAEEFISHIKHRNSKSFTEIALPLVRLGIAVVPTMPGLRYPKLPNWPELATTSESKVRTWSEENPLSNCCCVAKNGGVGMYDIDDLNACLAMGMPPLPDTFTVKSPKGRHGYFRHTPETEALGNRDIRDGSKRMIFELKGHNKACCAPGCVREDGGEYLVEKDLPIVEGLDPDFLFWIQEHSKTSVRSSDATPRRFHPDFEPEDLLEYYSTWEMADEFSKDNLNYHVFASCPIKGGPHDDQIKSKKTCLIFGNRIGFDCKVCGEEYGWRELVAHMEEEGIPEYPYYIYADEDDELVLEGVDAPSDETEESPSDERLTESDETNSPAVDTTGYRYEMTDTGNAERLVRRFGAKIRYVRDQGVWRIWDGKRWKTDRRNNVDRMAKIIVTELSDWAGEPEEEDEQKRRRKWAFISGGKERRNAMVTLAAMEKSIVSLTTDYDRDDWLFNCENGTVDLRTGKLLTHNRKWLCSKLSPVEFDPNATCPLWLKFLDEVLSSDREMVDFLAQAVGYSLTGDTNEQCFMFTYGNGANGKSVFNLAVKSIVGGYAQTASFDTFVVKKNDTGPKNDLAALVGARLVQASESKEGQHLDVSLIKDLTGSEEITVRFLHREFFSYKPKFKIWMTGNVLPIIRAMDHGTWRRIFTIPFDVTIAEDKKDKRLPAKLKKETAGILNWALRGLESYRKGGLTIPMKVQEATIEYKEGQDIIGQFVKARCVSGADFRIKGSELYRSYKIWADVNHEYVFTERKFSELLLKSPGITRYTRDGAKWYKGVGQSQMSSADEETLTDKDGDVF